MPSAQEARSEWAGVAVRCGSHRLVRTQEPLVLLDTPLRNQPARQTSSYMYFSVVLSLSGRPAARALSEALPRRCLCDHEVLSYRLPGGRRKPRTIFSLQITTRSGTVVASHSLSVPRSYAWSESWTFVPPGPTMYPTATRGAEPGPTHRFQRVLGGGLLEGRLTPHFACTCAAYLTSDRLSRSPYSGVPSGTDKSRLRHLVLC